MDYFDWMRESAPDFIKPYFQLWDLRDSLENTEWLKSIKENKLFDIVNCTEVGEHIDPDYAEIFLKNLYDLTNKYLVMSWSNTTEDQHLNPLSVEDFHRLMKKNNFILNIEKTQLLYNNALITFENEFFTLKEFAKEWYEQPRNKHQKGGLSVNEQVNQEVIPTRMFTKQLNHPTNPTTENAGIPTWYLDCGLSVWEKK